MHTVHLTWTWHFCGPLHCGSGVSTAGVADRLVQRTIDRKLAPIDGEAVKGALRMGAEHVLAWVKGTPLEYQATAPVEPRHPVLAAVFGGTAQSHFSAGSVDTASAMTVAATRIDPSTGTAKAETLRTVEVVGHGARYHCSVLVATTRSHESVATLLVAALAAAENVGAKAGIGWGEATVESPKLVIDEVEQPDLDALLAEQRLRALAEPAADDAVAERQTQPTPRTPPEQSKAPCWYRFEVELKEPCVLGTGAIVGNHMPTSSWLPSQTLRGALAAAWYRQGDGHDDVTSRLWFDTRWTPGLPGHDTWGARRPAVFVPAPMSYDVPKRGKPLQIRDASEGLWSDEHLKPIRDRWVALTGNGEVRLHTPGVQARMHVARNYVTGSKRHGVLFSRDGLAPEGTTFHGWARMPELPLERHSTEIWLARRKSAGKGRATVTFTPASDGPSMAALASEAGQLSTPSSLEGEVLVTLLSLIEVRDADSGHLLTALSPADWTRLLGVSVDEVTFVRFAGTRSGGWWSAWGHQRTPRASLAAGSVWKLRLTEGTSLARGLRHVGERTHEGLGWLAVAPHWVGRSGPVAKADEASKRGRRPWPGAEDVAAGSVDALIQEALDVSQDAGTARAALQDLAARLPMAADATQIATHLSEAGRVWRYMTDTDRRKPERLGSWQRCIATAPLGQVLQDRVLRSASNTVEYMERRLALELLLIVSGRADR